MDCWMGIGRPRATSPWSAEAEAPAVRRALPVHTRCLSRGAAHQPGDAVAWVSRPQLLVKLSGAVWIWRATTAGQRLDPRCVGGRGAGLGCSRDDIARAISRNSGCRHDAYAYGCHACENLVQGSRTGALHTVRFARLRAAVLQQGAA